VKERQKNGWRKANCNNVQEISLMENCEQNCKAKIESFEKIAWNLPRKTRETLNLSHAESSRM
jgi:hypothetical protein